MKRHGIGELVGATGLVANVVAAHVPKRLADALVAECGIPAGLRAAELRREDRMKLVERLVAYPLPWTDHEGFKKAEVTGGGVALDEVDPRTLESRRVRGLFLCGEILDAFGPIGGHNFAWAWATGRMAGTGRRRKRRRDDFYVNRKNRPDPFSTGATSSASPPSSDAWTDRRTRRSGSLPRARVLRLHPLEHVGEPCGRDADCAERADRVRVGLALEVARVAGVQEGGRRGGGQRADVTDHDRDQARDERALDHRAHAVPALEVPDLVREDGDHVVGVLRERDQVVGHDHDARRQRHRIRAECIALAEHEPRVARELRRQR